MSNKGKQIHNTWCNLMIEKANNKPIKTVKADTSTITGIKRNNYTKDELIALLAN